ncbi:thioesterase II family protein [Gillisia sp. Hel_I_29]|uniref:thioesterase II family protein n=1 Tax=Gillisia sp. Hel_I_29 TaxID=1249975 RepID=UPI0005564408|nr:thioesterase domain-containing protein [Gillisia sp. Hel_I_29]
MKYKRDRVLILFHFAGGNIFSLNKIKTSLTFIDVKVVELPGRGKRVGKKLLNNIDDMVEDMYNQVVPIIKDYEYYYFFGHSMGALISFLLGHLIKSKLNRLPSCLFISGRGGPSYIKESENLSVLPSLEFRKKLKELGGCPDELLVNEDLMSFFEPILRADFEAVENYEYKAFRPLETKIIALYGLDEEIDENQMLHWQKESTLPIEVIELPGDHFFIFKNVTLISNIIRQNIYNLSTIKKIN